MDRKVMAAARALEKQGAELGEVSIPMHVIGPCIFKAIILEGASEFMIRSGGAGTNWAGFYNTTLAEAFIRGRRARPSDIPPSVLTVLLAGAYMQRYYHGRYYGKAQNVRHLLTQAYDDALKTFDLLLMPTVPFRATPIPPPDCSIEDYMFYSQNLVNNTCQGDVTGHPSISIPCGTADDLPIGMMITGRHFDDFLVIAAAAAFERTGDWRRM